MTFPPCKNCAGSGLGAPAGADLKALRESAGSSMTATAAGMGVSRAWVLRVESGKSAAPDRFVDYYAVNFE